MLHLLLLVLVVITKAQHPTFQGHVSTDNQLFEGDDCKIDGKSGTCLSLSACPIILSDKVITQQPPTCGYNDSVPIVCCPQKNDTEEYSKGCVSSVNNELYPLNSSIFYMCEELKCSQDSWIPTKEHDPDCELPFFAAVAKDEISKVKEFLKKGISPNVKNKKGASIALKAIQNGHLEILSTLLENGADPQGPTALSHEESNLLLYAVAHESLEVIDILLGHGADINKHIYGSTPLRNAIKRKDIKIIKLLVEHKANVNEINIYKDKTVLIYGIATGNKDIVNLLIANGADVNDIAISEITALETAVILGNNEIVKLLLDNKAELNTRSHYSTGGTVLVDAIKQNHLDIAMTLLEYGADPNYAPHEGETALVLASQKNNTSTLVDLLLEKGANINSTDINGNTALGVASNFGFKDVVETLIHHGADVNMKTTQYPYNTALISAASNNYSNIVTTLLENGANLSITNKEGNTALILAARNNYSNIVTQLLENGANPSISNERGDTALFIAAVNNYLNIVTTLLENGANPNITKYRESCGSLCLTFSAEELSWDDAEAACVSNNGHLASFAENPEAYIDYVLQNYANVKFWVGGSDTANEGSWVWITGEPFYQFPWGEDEPNNHHGNEDCLEIDGYGHYNDLGCHYKLRYICESGDSAFEKVVTNGNVGVTKLLIEYGADKLLIEYVAVPGKVNTSVAYSTFLLEKLINIMAYKEPKQYLETMDLLLKNGAPIDAVNMDGKTALILASSTSHNISSSTRVEIATLLLYHNATVNLTDNDGYSALLWATKHGILNLVELLLENDASVNQANSNGITPLMFASSSDPTDSQEIVELLLQNNANINDTDNSGASVLMYALKHERESYNKSYKFELIKTLLENGANPVVISMDSYESSTPLLLAIANQHLPTVRILLDYGSDVNENRYGYTPLGKAVSVSNAAIIEELIDQGADVNENSFYKAETLLIQAVKIGDVEVIKTLLKHGADINQDALDGNTAIHESIMKNNTEIVNLFLNQNANANTKSNLKNGGTVLHQAVKIGNIDIVSALLDKGSDPNIVTNRDNTVLAEAVESDNMEILAALLDHGADINGGKCILNEAVHNENAVALKILLTNGANVNSTYCRRTALHDVIYAIKGSRAMEMMKLLVQYKTGINIADSSGITPLMTLLQCSDFENPQYPAINYLLNNGAQTNMSDERGRTVLEHFLRNPCNYDNKSLQELLKSPLMDKANVQQKTLYGQTMLELTIRKCYYRSECYSQEDISIIISMLLEQGADANEITSNGVSPIEYAIDEEQDGAVRALLLNGVNPNQKTSDGSTLLVKAVENGNEDMVHALLNHKAQVDAIDARGTTALSLAAQKGYVQIVQLLVDHGANIATADTYGNTPLMYAAQFGQDEVVHLLLNSGANIDTSNKSGVTALLLATLNKRNDVIQTLISHGADATLTNRRGISPLTLASTFGEENPFASLPVFVNSAHHQ